LVELELGFEISSELELELGFFISIELELVGLKESELFEHYIYIYIYIYILVMSKRD
jgi:hypothetical protein